MCKAPYWRSGFACGAAMISGVLLMGTGCAGHKSSLTQGLAATTASAEAVRAAVATPSPARANRDTNFSVSAKSGSVTHTPVYFRSDAEHRDDNDADFGISGEDLYLWIPEAAGFFISIALHPIDVVITPPWTQMESDGRRVKRAAPDHRIEHGNG